MKLYVKKPKSTKTPRGVRHALLEPEGKKGIKGKETVGFRSLCGTRSQTLTSRQHQPLVDPQVLNPKIRARANCLDSIHHLFFPCIFRHQVGGSAEITYALFRLAGVPIFRAGVRFERPIVGIEIARECSSIHSACALFFTGLIVGHLFLKSLGAKFCLAILTITIAIFTNAVRIVTLWSLATMVDIGFLYGNLHHNGGILFLLASLSVLLGCVYLLRRLESTRYRFVTP